jgi:hypothetical protein
MNKIISGLLLGAALATGAPAQAGLLGQTIQGSYHLPSVGTVFGNFSYSTNPFVVGAGSDSTLIVSGIFGIDVNFHDDGLILTLPAAGWSKGAFHGPVFDLLSGDFPSVAVIQASGGQTVSASIIGGDLYINWQGQFFASGDTVTLRFTGPVGVPAPASLALFGLGLVGLAAFRRR